MVKISPSQLLLPISLIAVVLLGSLGFQAVQVLQARKDLLQMQSRQDKPLEETEKLKNQFIALAVGTKKLAADGDKNAALIVDRMQKAGIRFDEQKPTLPEGESAPAPENSTADVKP